MWSNVPKWEYLAGNAQNEWKVCWSWCSSWRDNGETFFLSTYSVSSDALQLSLRQVSNGHRGRSRPAEQHFIMRRIFCFRLRVQICTATEKVLSFFGCCCYETVLQNTGALSTFHKSLVQLLSHWPRSWRTPDQPTRWVLASQGPNWPPRQPCNPSCRSPPPQPAGRHREDEGCAQLWRLRERNMTIL